VESRWYEIFS
jgi:hypothetical protein